MTKTCVLATCLALVAASGCDEPTLAEDGGPALDASVLDGGEGDGGSTPVDGAVSDGAVPGDGSIPDAGPPASTVLVGLTEGDEVIHSVAARVAAPDEAVRVVVSAVGADGVECTSEVRSFECLLDVTSIAPGAFTVRAIGYDAGDAEVGQDEVSLVRRDVPDPCAGVTGDHIDCALARADAGDAAGFTGMSYLNYDDRHALVNTGRMTGIDAQVHAAVPTSPPDGVVLGIGNESRACRPTGGWSSRPRCDSVSKAIGHYDANVLMFWPEHRDHGTRDFFQWQGEFYDLSQGSSGTERDEVTKMLTALAMLDPAARTEMVSAGTVASTASMLLRRSRLTTDAAYLTPEAHVTALGNTDNGDALMALAAAIRSGELPPIARVASVSDDFPSEWSMTQSLSTDYAIGWTPITTPTDTPAGTFDVVVDLSTSSDPAGRDLIFFPALLRGDAADVTITREDPAGTQWRIRGSFPTDRVISTGGHDRTVSRVTVGFFAHNNLWLGAPALVSIGGRATRDAAPDSNNLD